MNLEEQNSVKTTVKQKFRQVVFDGEQVKYFDDAESEYEKLVHGVGIRILTDKSFFKLEGKDVIDFLHRVSTNDIAGLNRDEKINTLFTNEKGRLIDRTCLMHCGDEHILIGNLHHKELLKRWIEKYIIMEDIKIEDASSNYCFFEVLGPQADSFMTLICGSCIDELDERKILKVSAESIPISVMKFTDLNDKVKFWISLDVNFFNQFIDYVKNEAHVFDFGFVGMDAYSRYRVEQGIPAAPNEINDLFNPYDIGLIEDVSFTKGCYIGQEVIARIDTYDKAQRQLLGFALNETINLNGEPASLKIDENTDAGYITSVTESNKINGSLGLSVIKKKFVDFDSEVVFSSNGNSIKGSFKKLPV